MDLTDRIIEAISRDLTVQEICEKYAKDGSPEDIFFAYHAAQILIRDRATEETTA